MNDTVETSQYCYYSRGDTLTLTLVMALAARDGYPRYEIVSQRAVVVTCTLEQWIDLLKEAKFGGERPIQAPQYEEVVAPRRELRAAARV